jgi:hypothetical protein
MIKAITGVLMLASASVLAPTAHADTPAPTPTLAQEINTIAWASVISAQIVTAPIYTPATQIPVVVANTAAPIAAPIVSAPTQAVATAIAGQVPAVVQTTTQSLPVPPVVTAALQPVVQVVTNEARNVLVPFGVPDQLVSLPSQFFPAP